MTDPRAEEILEGFRIHKTEGHDSERAPVAGCRFCDYRIEELPLVAVPDPEAEEDRLPVFRVVDPSGRGFHSGWTFGKPYGHLDPDEVEVAEAVICRSKKEKA